ncbi:MAG: HlyC/CorC family transporter [Planctomycetes bacterium]|nr:HlyC/CorC family transporter [Planctomycetota bacterium]
MDDNLSIVVGLLAGVIYALGQAAESALHNYSHTKLEKSIPDPQRLDRVNAGLKDFDRHVFSLTLAHALFGGIAMVMLYRGLAPRLGAGTLALLLVLLVLGLTGVVRELVYRSPEASVLRFLPLIRLTTRLWSPITIPLMTIGRLVESSRPGAEEASDEDEAVEDILDAVSEGEAEGVLHGTAADYIENIMDSRDRVVREIMTPRTSMISAPIDSDLDQALEILDREGHSRVPLWEGSRDSIVGILYFKDVLKQLRQLQQGERRIRDIARAPLFVSESKKINDLLKELQAQKVHIAIVLDEFGSASGLVTMEDILEEIVGEVQDEFDDEEEVPDFAVADDGRIELDATVSIDLLNERLELSLPEDEDFDTIGGLLAARLGKVPSTGEILALDGVEIEVADADDRRVKRVWISTAAGPAAN